MTKHHVYKLTEYGKRLLASVGITDKFVAKVIKEEKKKLEGKK